ncbi:MAG: hypothetical protein KGN02_02935 [bacterium]|nr:hypothetical protein [bacterium]
MLHALALLLALASSSPPPSPAASLPPSGTYRTEIRKRFEAFGYAGELRLRVAHGYINGTYRPEGGLVTPVTGGTDGTHVWLDFTTFGSLHVEGRFENGRIVGMGTPRSRGTTVYVFTATFERP